MQHPHIMCEPRIKNSECTREIKRKNYVVQRRGSCRATNAAHLRTAMAWPRAHWGAETTRSPQWFVENNFLHSTSAKVRLAPWIGFSHWWIGSWKKNIFLGGCNGHQFHCFGIIHGVAVAWSFFGGPAASGVPIAPRLDSRICCCTFSFRDWHAAFVKNELEDLSCLMESLEKSGIAAVMWCFPVLTLQWAENDKMSTVAAWCRGRGNFQFACIPQNMVQESTSGGVNDQIVKKNINKN